FTTAEAARLDDVERTALFHLRRMLEAHVGPTLEPTVHKLRRREDLVESMRRRLHSGTVQLSRPDGFVLGGAWFETMTPYTDLRRRGGPLMLDTDLRAATRADEELREKAAAEALRRVLDFMALATEAHEARHALDTLETRVLPPPAPLLELMAG